MLKFVASMQKLFAQSLAREDRGATAVEYGLIVALIAAVIVAVVLTLGKQVSDAFSYVSSQI